MRPKLVAIKVSGGHLIPVIMRASSRGRRRRDFEASIILRATIAVGPSRPGCTGPLSFPGLGGPDRVQDGQVIGICEGLVAGLGGRDLLAVVVEDGGEHAERRARRGRLDGRGGLPGPFGMNVV